MDVLNKSQGLGSIRFLTGPLAGRTIQISKPMMTIGREPTNDIVISDPLVSRQHARLVNNGGQWSIEKLSLQNVVTVNQRDVQQSPIADRDTIGLGNGTTFLFLVSPDLAAPAVSLQQPAPQNPYMPPLPPQQLYAPSQPLPPQQPFAQPAFHTIAGSPPVGSSGAQPPVKPVVYSEATPPGIAPGTPSIEASSNIHPNKQALPLTKQVINIGREPSNDLVISEPVVSGFHAQIVREGNQYVFVHPHPSRGKTLNGLIYNGNHIPGNQAFRKPLARGDFFRIGDEHGTMVTISYDDGSGAAQDIVPEIRPIPLGAPVITIGRLPENMVVLDHPQVSNQPLRPGDEIRIGPFNFTYTGTQLTQRDESGGIRIDALGLYKEGSKKTIILDNISIAIPQRKFVALVGGSGAGKSTLMDALNGLRPAHKGTVFYNGKDYYQHLAAFSTQLGYVPQDDIIHRDLTVERALYYTARMRLPDDFTEEQIHQRIDEVLDDVEMKFRRKLLVSKLSGGQRKRVSIALELLANPSLFFLDEPTSGLDPGLDRKMMFLLRKLADKGHTIILVTHATNNINACDYICFLAQGGRLAYFGPPNEAKAYFGKTDFAEIYSALEPTEENPNIPLEAENRFKASPQFQQYVVTSLNKSPAAQADRQPETTGVIPPKRGNPWRQFSLLSLRYLELLKNDVVNLLILILQAPLIALILYLLLTPGGHGIFDPTTIAGCQLHPPILPPITKSVSNSASCQNQVNQFLLLGNTESQALQLTQAYIIPGAGNDSQKYLFIMAFAAAMFGIVNGVREIVKEAPIYRRERTVNLGIVPYMFSKIMVLGLLCLIQSAVLVLVVNLAAPIQQGIILPAPVEIYITMALTALAGLMLGLMISAIAPNNDRAVSLIPLLLVPQVIFSGILFKLDGPFLQAFGSLFAVRWGMAAAGSSIGIHGDKIGGDSWTYQGTLFSTNSQTDATLHLLLCWFVLVAMIFILGGLTAYFLKRKDIRS